MNDRRTEDLTVRYRAAADQAQASGMALVEMHGNLQRAQYSALLEQVARLSMHAALGGAEVVATLTAEERRRHEDAIATRIDNRALEIATDALEARNREAT